MVAEADNMDAKDQLEFKIGMIVERIIEDTWFIGKIVEYSSRRGECSIRYLDDNLLESNVPIDEIRISSQNININEIRAEKKSTLPKPLIGLVEDDSELRSVHQPVAIVHNDADTEKAIIINGSDKKLAAGGGIRALRYLKKA
mmetsp:Transcript_11621/g.11999  ORF Transcript_11621/g.11999 Transcript_11621/m.11999 type:complete len:143 (+) Transcript_11621:57-485(+)